MVRKKPVNGLVRDEYGGFPASHVTPQAPTWLAAPVVGPWRWPLGALVYLNGEGGHGKSLVTCHLAAAVTRGQAWPDGGKSTTRPGNVLMLNADDSIEKNVVNRLNAAGADMDKVRFLPDVREEAGLAVYKRLYLPGKDDSLLNLLIEYIVKYKIKLVVMDPVAVFFRIGPGVRARVMDKLMDAAEKHEFTMVLVRHIPGYKAQGDGDRGAGGYEFGTACRAGYDVIADKKYNMDAQERGDKSERFILRTVKNSYESKAPARAYTTHQSTDRTHHKATFVTFEPEAVTIEQIDRMLALQDDQTSKSFAEEWLTHQLLDAGDEGMWRSDLVIKAHAAGVPESTLDRVAKSLKVVKRSKGGQKDGRPTRASRWYHPNYAPAS